MKKYFIFTLFFGLVSLPFSVFAVLSCSVVASSTCTTGTVVLRMSSSSNAHAELPSQSNSSYDNTVICCSGSQPLGNTCTASSTTFLKLQNVTNSHVQERTQSGYTNNVCIAINIGTTTSGYQDNSCSGYDTTIASISSSTNATIGGPTAYTRKVCGSETDGIQTITFELSTSTIYFGQVSSLSTRYGSSTNTQGDNTETEAHTLKVKTNATSGYLVTVRGDTLNLGFVPTNATNTISAIGGTNTPSSLGSEQFGLRMVASGGIGTVAAPYSASGFAYDATGVISSQVASASLGDNATTTYSVRYITNIANTTEYGSYTANLVYVATANF